jgi:hypothetical protein
MAFSTRLLTTRPNKLDYPSCVTASSSLVMLTCEVGGVGCAAGDEPEDGVFPSDLGESHAREDILQNPLTEIEGKGLGMSVPPREPTV